MSLKYKTQRIRGSRSQFLQRVAAREAYEVWSCEPGRVKFRFAHLHLRIGPHLPLAIVDVVELFDAGGLNLARAGYRCTGQDTPRKRARIHARWMPLLGDAARDRQRLGFSPFSQRQILPAAKARRMNAFDVTVANQDDLGQGSALAPIQALTFLAQILACARSIAS